MCLLTYFPPKVQPNRVELLCGVEANPMGHGYAIVDWHGGRIITRKSMDGATLIDQFMKDRKRYPWGPALFHSRLATAGEVTEYNCHPFYVGGDKRTVVAHNGILPPQAQPRKGDRRSDTRKFAEDLLPYRNIRTLKGRRKLGKWLQGDKLVILTLDPAHKYSSYIINEHCGEWTKKGIWYSNSSYDPLYRWTYKYRAWDDDDWAGFGYGDTGTGWSNPSTVTTAECLRPGCDTYTYREVCTACRIAGWRPDMFRPMLATRKGDETCSACGSIGTVSLVNNVCTLCKVCQDCLEDTEEDVCLCYTPSQLDRLTSSTSLHADPVDSLDLDEVLAAWEGREGGGVGREEWESLKAKARARAQTNGAGPRQYVATPDGVVTPTGSETDPSQDQEPAPVSDGVESTEA